MASKAATPTDDFSLDDIKLDDFPMEDNALFADLDNEMRADGGKGKAGGYDLDLTLDVGEGTSDETAMPALEEPGELQLDDTMDLDLNLDEPAKGDAGGGDLDLNLDEAPAADTGGGDLDLNLDLDEGSKGSGDLDLDLKLEEAPSAEADGGDLDLNLDLDDSGKSAGGDVDLEMGDIDLNLDEPGALSADSLSLDEPETPGLSMEDPNEPKFDLDLPEEPSLDAPADEDDGISLTLAEPEAAEPAAPPMPEPDLPPMPEPDLPALSAEPELSLDDGFSLDTLPETTPGEPDASGDFTAAADINLDDVDLSLDTTGGTAAAMEPMGAQVDLQPVETAPSMEEGFDLPPLVESKGDMDSGPAEEFVAVPDVKLTEDEVLELNLPQTEVGAAEPEFTMAPEPMGMPLAASMGAPMAAMSGGGMPGGEFRLTEPLAMGRASGAGMALREPAAPAMRMGGTPAAPREAAVSQDILLSIPHKISVQMGSVSLVGKDIRNLAYGSVVQLNRTVGEPVDLLLDGRSIAQGEIVLINGKNLGVRILALSK